jgi:sec-independent protein translocase protein TatA
MGSFSIWHWLVVLVIVMLLFGAGKIPKLAGDMAKGIKAFKAGMKDEDNEAAAAPPPPPQVTANATMAAEPKKEAPKV